MEDTREEALDLLIELADARPDDVALDYAVVPSLAVFAVAPIVSSLQAVAERPDICEEGRRLAAELDLANVDFQLADLLALPHQPETFSLTTCCEGLHLLTDPIAALSELRRVTSSGGRIVLVEPVVDEVLDGPFNDLARVVDPSHRRYFLQAELELLTREAGLRVARKGFVRRTIDLEYWAQAAGAPATRATLVSEQFRSLPIEAQMRLDAAFSDAAISFSYDLCGLRLERV